MCCQLHCYSDRSPVKNNKEMAKESANMVHNVTLCFQVFSWRTLALENFAWTTILCIYIHTHRVAQVLLVLTVPVYS